MGGPGAALRELGEGATWEAETLGWETGVFQERPEGPAAGAEGRKGGQVGCWVGEEARVR